MKPTQSHFDLTPKDLRSLARCVDVIGTDAFPAEISVLCSLIAGAETVFLSAFFDDHKPIGLYASHSDSEQKSALDLYLDVAYLLDPFYLLFRQKSDDTVMALQDVAPDDFQSSEYYDRFYRAMGLTDECGLMVYLGEGAALFFSCGVADHTRRTNSRRLRLAAPVIGALVRRHWTVLSPQQPDGSGRLAAHLKTSFEAFGSSVLSPREAEIVRMILRGHSSKAIAIEFNNSPETIKVHRKRAYTKLGVASQGELLSIFLQALSRMPPTAKGDPLAFLVA